ncbi:MAG: glycosyltransferase family 2 protein [Patescibacteria group bacterium]
MNLSVIIPAYNEEKNIRSTVEGLVSVFKNKTFNDYEILIFNDKSTDKTGEIADNLAGEYKGVRVIHNPVNRGFGYNYKKGVELAQGKYALMIPGDDETDLGSIDSLLNSIGKADLILSYTANMEVRKLFRRIVSGIFVKFLNAMFGLRLKYYNGICIHRTDLARKSVPTTFGFAFAAEMTIKLLKSGFSFVEVPIRIKPTDKSSAFKAKNIISVIKTIISLFWRINIKRERIRIK